MRRRLSALSVVMLLATFLSVAVLRTAHAAAGCRVQYTVLYSSTGFFGVDLRLTNLGDPVTSWQLTWSFTAGQRIAQGWYGAFSQSGADVTVDNESWNGALATGAKLYVGFNAYQGDTNPPPEGFAFNGTPCDVVLPSPTASPTAPIPPLDPVGYVLDVDLAPGGFNPVRRVAAGGVHALGYSDRPTTSSLRPLRLNKIVQQGPSPSPLSEGDPLLVAAQADRAGIGQYIRMSDMVPGYPVVGPSWGSWLSRVDSMVHARLDAYNVGNVVAWEIWNEPDQTWNSVAAGPFNIGWLRTHRQIRLYDKVTPIVGPSLSHWDPAFMHSFLTYARANDVLPQVVSWHEVDRTPSRIAANVEEYRQLEQWLGIGPLPISISGYGDRDEVHVPGRMASYVAKLERARVADAQRAFWGQPGTVNGLVANNNQPTGAWWLYKWYGDMAGTMLQTAPPAQTGLDGFASYDSTRQLVHVVVGDQAGTNSVRLSHLDLGTTVRVTVESLPNRGPYVVAGEPTVVSDQHYQVVNGELVVHIPNMRTLDAYRLVVQPAGGTTDFQRRYEAENASLFRATPMPSGNASNGGYVGGITAGVDPRFGSYVDFVVQVPATREYTMEVSYSNAAAAAVVQGLSVNGDRYRALSYAPTAPGAFQSTSVQVGLQAGYNVIRLAKCAFSGSSGISPGCASGSVDLDYIELA